MMIYEHPAVSMNVPPVKKRKAGQALAHPAIVSGQYNCQKN
jgi:hypothetical protein